jgi:hypothetical protein
MPLCVVTIDHFKVNMVLIVSVLNNKNKNKCSTFVVILAFLMSVIIRYTNAAQRGVQ